MKTLLPSSVLFKYVIDKLLLRKSRNVSVVQGTTFVLQKKTDPRQKLLATISTGTGVREVKLQILRYAHNVGQSMH